MSYGDNPKKFVQTFLFFLYQSANIEEKCKLQNVCDHIFLTQTKRTVFKKQNTISCRKHAAAPRRWRQYSLSVEEYPNSTAVISPPPRRRGRLANMYTGIPAVCLAVSTATYNSFDPRKKGTNHDFN